MELRCDAPPFISSHSAPDRLNSYPGELRTDGGRTRTMKNVTSRQVRSQLGTQRVYSGRNLDLISFPLGGIGTGSVGLSGRGGLVDWEIFNRPNVGGQFPQTFPIVWAREKGQEPVCRILLAPTQPPYQHDGLGNPHMNGEGFPHMDSCMFRGEFPFARIDFACRQLPVKIELEAYNPFVPSDPDASGFPAAVLRYTVTNTARRDVNFTVAWSLLNMVGSIGSAGNSGAAGDCGAGDGVSQPGIEFGFGRNVNEYVNRGGLHGLVFSSKKWPKEHARFGSMALVTPEESATVLTHWLREGWFTPKHEFWDTFSTTGEFSDRTYGPSPDGQTDAGALGVCASLKPRQSTTVTFYLTWYFPNFEKYWGNVPCCSSSECGEKTATTEKSDGIQTSEPPKTPARPTWRNYYAKQFRNAFDVALKLYDQEEYLYAQTTAFHDALFGSTLPPEVLDAVSSQMAILKSATCLRLSDGTFYGFEGCAPTTGCCEGSCTHVWNYQQALPFLFPSLERSMRSADYRHNMREDGSMCFRLQLPLGSKPNDFHAAADGQLGGVIKTYRDWKISGDDAWLKSVWSKVKRALDFAWAHWDHDRDGVIEGIQHNTYDIEFVGPNPLTTGFYLAALVAGAEMAEHFGELLAAAEYRSLYERGRAWVEKNLFNGEFYVQQYEPDAAPKFQFGEGCLSDQLLGQQLAAIAGLGSILDEAQVRKTLKSIFRHNWKKNLTEHANAQRVYALNDEAGLLLCTWPNGGRPAVPFPYSDEVWTGIEYQVAAHLVMEGMTREGLAIVKGARERYDGVRRNPWNEFECGNHYARAMASYGLLLAYSGFTYDLTKGCIGFVPKINERNFRTFWSLDNAWGVYTQTPKQATLEVLYGAIKLKQLDLPAFAARKRSVKVHIGKNRQTVAPDEAGSIALGRAVAVKAGEVVVMT